MLIKKNVKLGKIFAISKSISFLQFWIDCILKNTVQHVPQKRLTSELWDVKKHDELWYLLLQKLIGNSQTISKIYLPLPTVVWWWRRWAQTILHPTTNCIVFKLLFWLKREYKSLYRKQFALLNNNNVLQYLLPPPSYQHNFPILSIISKGYSKASPLGSDCWKPRWGCNPALRWPSRPINLVFRGSYLTIVLRSKGKIPNLCASYKWSPLKSYKRPSH